MTDSEKIKVSDVTVLQTANGSTPASAPVDTTKRAPGRPVGSRNANGKVPGSGRRAGTPNRSTEVGRSFIIDRGWPLAFLCDLAAGRQVSVANPENPRKKIKVYPDMKERRAAAAILAPMVTPTLKSSDFNLAVDGNPNNDLNFTVVLVAPNRDADDM